MQARNTQPPEISLPELRLGHHLASAIDDDESWLLVRAEDEGDCRCEWRGCFRVADGEWDDGW